MKKRIYLAYGSNLNVEQMKMRCPSAKIVGTGEIPDYELLFKGSKTGSYLTIEQCKGESVPVALWEVTADDEMSLDRYEGYPDFYYKKQMLISVKEKGKTYTVPAFVYIMHEERKLGQPSLFYFRTCEIGYKYFGFDRQVLVEAYMKSKGSAVNER